MKSLSETGEVHPEKVLENLRDTRLMLKRVTELLQPVKLQEQQARAIFESLTELSHQVDALESEVGYLLEINTCRQIMLSDSIAYIKKLEQQIQELKS